MLNFIYVDAQTQTQTLKFNAFFRSHSLINSFKGLKRQTFPSTLCPLTADNEQLNIVRFKMDQTNGNSQREVGQLS